MRLNLIHYYFCVNSTLFKRLSRIQSQGLCLSSSKYRKLNKIEDIIMEKHTQALLSSSDNKKVTPSWCNRSKVAVTIALISTTTGIIILGSFLVLDAAETTPPATSLTPDAEKWMKIGIENANRDLDKFDAIAADLSSGSEDYTALDQQLILLQKQIIEVGDNNRILIPQILDVITKINGFLEGDCPSVWSKMALKALIWYVDGKRDNKSYYLLDGAQLWATLRIQVLRKMLGGSAVDKLIGELGSMQKDTASLRDELDDNAQIFVKGIKDIHALVGDIGGNLAELKEIAKRLLVVSKENEKFLANTKKLEDEAAKLVALYKD